MIYLTVALAGALGAACRYMLEAFVQRKVYSSFPWGTYLVNITGSFALGVVLALAISYQVPEMWVIVSGTGFLGAYTTFSGWMVQTIQLIESKAYKYAFLNILYSTISGVLAAALGYASVIMLV